MCGLAPGCPAATDWLALVMHCWDTRLRGLAPGLVTRAYVDDLSAYTSEEGSVDDVQIAWRCTSEFGESFRLVLNQEKSVRYATHPRDVEALEVEDGPPVRASFRDLGVAQRVSLLRGPVTPPTVWLLLTAVWTDALD